MTSILVVDDCPVDRRLIGHLLTHNTDWDIRYAEDGQVAMEMVERERFDLVVTDLQMPRLNGLQLVQQIRGQVPSLPVLLVTSKGSQDIAVQALRTGATHYSPKSRLSRDLLATARHVLTFAQQLRGTEAAAVSDGGKFSFVLENDTAMIGPLIATLEANLPDWTESDRLRIGMAINEAICNAIYHGNLEVDSDLRVDDESRFYALVADRAEKPPYADRRVRVLAEFTSKAIKVTVSDQGPGFDAACVSDPRCQENLEKLSGRGLLLIRSFMDDVTHNDSGNEISMVKRR